MEKKNLIVIHLESVNILTLNNNMDCFPCLNRLKEKSIFYTNYYSSATSTLMVTTDLFYGSYQFENAENARSMFGIIPKERTLLDNLSEEGYQTMCLYLGRMMKSSDLEKYFRLLSSKGVIYNSDADEQVLLAKIREISNGANPFAVFFRNDRSHISCVNEFSDSDISSNNYGERFKYVDHIIGDIISILRDANCMDNTVIVIYGDHGDDFFGHGMHEGYMHAIEPLPYLIHCPLIFYDGGIGYVDKSLIGTLDISRLIWNHMTGGGISPKKEKVFSRNLFVAQRNNRNSFNKSYSVTNGAYTLVVSSKGLEMYVNKIDTTGHCNILEFFILHEGTITYNHKFDFLKSTHYGYYFNAGEIDNIRQTYSFLHRELTTFVKELYGDGHAMSFDEVRQGTVSTLEGTRLRYRETLSSVGLKGKKLLQFCDDTWVYRFCKAFYRYIINH